MENMVKLHAGTLSVVERLCRFRSKLSESSYMTWESVVRLSCFATCY